MDVEAPWQPLGRQLVFTAKALREAFEEALEATGGSLGAWIVLNGLSDEGFVSQTALASHAHVEGATITHHLDRLEALGLVRRRPDPTDRRVRRIELTPAGIRLHRRMLAVAREFDAATTAGLSEREQAELRRALDCIRSNLEARRAPALRPRAGLKRAERHSQ